MKFFRDSFYKQDKKVILDILAFDQNHAKETKPFPERGLFYLSKIHSKQIQSGNNYNILKPTTIKYSSSNQISATILNFKIKYQTYATLCV